jgi:hypothetical protein
MIRAGFMAGATAGLALAFLQWAAFIVGLLSYQIYILIASIILPGTLTYSITGYLVGFTIHTAFFGLLGILFAYILHHRFDKAITWGIAFGVTTLVILSGFAIDALTAVPPFWALPLPELLFTVISRLGYGAFLGYLYRQYMSLPIR